MQVGRPRIRVDTIPSTMDLALALAEAGATTGTVVQAGHQSAGRGRAGRSWDAPPWSSLLLSFTWQTHRPRAGLGIVSPLLGLAVAQTVEGFTGIATTVKWPNDVLVEGRKIAGILVVNRVLPDRPGTCLVAGIGLNVNSLPADLPETGTSLRVVLGESVRLDAVRDALLDRLSDVMTVLETGREAGLMPGIDDRLAFRGERVTVSDGPRRIDGVLRGLDPGGALVLECDTGDEVAIVAGELTRGPRMRL